MLASLSSFGSAQSRTISPFRQEVVGAAVVQSTADVIPQIQNGFVVMPSQIVENPLPPNLIGVGAPNHLVPGGMLSTPRGRTRSAFPGIDNTGWTPPDCDFAVGPQYIVSTVNSSIAFFRKADGSKVFEQSLGPGGTPQFFFDLPGVGSFVFDPKCFYDPISSRYFVLGLELDGAAGISKGLVAVSDDNNPNGTWYKYRVELKLTDGGNTYWMDYPGFGFNKDGVAICGNMFPLTGSGWGGVEFVLMPKAAMLTGGSFTATYLRDPNGGSAQIAETTDTGVDRIYGLSDASTTGLTTYAIKGITSSPTLVAANVAVPSHSGPGVPAQSTSGHSLDTIDSRIFTAVYRNGRLYGSHNVATSDGRVQTRWYEINTNGWPNSGTPSLRQSGSISGAGGQFAHMGAINANSLGDIAVLYTRSSSSIAADLVYSARFASDPLGSMGAPVLLRSTPAPYGGNGTNRWGDYFSVAVDPVDDATFWGLGMVGKPDGSWTTEIRSWQVTPPGGIVGIPADALSVSTILGNFTGGDLASVATSDNVAYTVDSQLLDKNFNPPGSGAQLLGQLAEIEEAFQIDPLATNLATVKVRVEAKAASGITQMLYLWNVGTGKFDYIQSFSMTASDRVNTLNLRASLFSRYIDANKRIKVRIRAINPVRQGRPTLTPVPFTLATDLVQVLYTLGN